MTERYITSPRGKTYYIISRHGNPYASAVIFLHGSALDHTLFDKQAAYFSKKHTVLCWDAPGHGKSRPYRDFSYENLAHELRAVMDAEAIETAVLTGHGIGALTAQVFYENYPDRVDAIVGIGACPFDKNYYSKFDLQLFKLAAFSRRLYSAKKLKASLARASAESSCGMENMLSTLEQYTKKELCTLIDDIISAFLKEGRSILLKCPVMLILGERDIAGKSAKYCVKWHQKENLPLHIIENAGHNAIADNPDACNALIENFLASLSNAKSFQTKKAEA